jgi:hypothetical protein
MNKYAAVIAITMFALGAVAGHSMTAPTPANVAANAAPASPLDLMRIAPAMQQTSYDAV